MPRLVLHNCILSLGGFKFKKGTDNSDIDDGLTQASTTVATTGSYDGSGDVGGRGDSGVSGYSGDSYFLLLLYGQQERSSGSILTTTNCGAQA